MSRRRQPGTPRLLRALNDRSALELLLAHGPLTRARLGELTGLSKVTASQLVERLEQRGLVERVGVSAGGRGPNAQLYAVVAASAYVVGMEIGPAGITAMAADITGSTLGRAEVEAAVSDDPVGVVHAALQQVADASKVPAEQLRHVVLGSPGVVDPGSGEVSFSWELPRWHRGLLAALHADLRRPVRIENDVNLAAVAEHRLGAGRGADDFVLFWVDRGLGLGVMLGGRLHQGVMGAAGEVGYLPVPGQPVTHGVSRRFKAPFGELAGADAVRRLAREHGFRAPTAAEALRAAREAGEERNGELFDELAVRRLAREHGFRAPTAAEALRAAREAGEERNGELFDELARRLALGAVAFSVVLDPGLVVLAGSIGAAAGPELAQRVEREVQAIAPVAPRVVTTEVTGDPVLHGALLTALDAAREEVFESAAPTDEPAPDPAEPAEVTP